MRNKAPVVMTTYDISYEPVYTEYHKKLPEEVKDKYERYVLSIQNHDSSVLNELESMSKKYENPVINNLLYNSLIIAERYNDAVKTAEHNFKTFPDYLFGRLNYAAAFILMKDFKSIPGIFNFKFDLKLIEPERNKFHISEILSFHKIMYYYHIGIGEYQNAKKHFDIISQIDVEGKVKKELSKIDFYIKKKKVIEIVFTILVTPFILTYMICDGIYKKIKGVARTKN